MIQRSALVFKVADFRADGCNCSCSNKPVSLKFVGGERNWDYRFTWIRDAAFTIYGFDHASGLQKKVSAFHEMAGGTLQKKSATDGSLQVMYGIDGSHDLP